MSDQDYSPIACGFHDRLLHFATLKAPVRLQLQAHETRDGIIQDVFTKEGAEYLTLSDGELIRLDLILGVEALY